MEITVSRQDLLRELTATQSVVERKTTIPILSNFLLEADGDRIVITATDLDQSIRTVVRGEGEEARILHHSGAQALRLHPPARRRRHVDQAAGEPLGADSRRPLQYADGGHGARELSAGAGVPRSGSVIEDSGGFAADSDCATIFAISNEESRYTLNGALLILKAGIDGDGGDRRPPPGAYREAGRELPRHHRGEEDAGSAQGAAGAAVAACQYRGRARGVCRR